MHVCGIDSGCGRKGFITRQAGRQAVEEWISVGALHRTILNILVVDMIFQVTVLDIYSNS